MKEIGRRANATHPLLSKAAAPGSTWLGICALAIFFATASRAAETHEIKVEKAGAAREQQERDVDQVALSSQEAAIAKLSGLLKKYRGTRQEPILLSKLADLEMQGASIRFRLAHGNAHRGKGGLNLAGYKKAMKHAIGTLTELIKKYPRFEEIAHAYFMRGKGFEEISDKAQATRDYLFLVKEYPEAEETTPAYMSLAEFSIQANDHGKAITYLVQVEKHPESVHFPFALYKLAWAHYNLKNIPSALSYVEKHVEFYVKQKAAAKVNGGLTASDEALKENMLLDATVFYMDGFEQKLSQCQLQDALPYFRKLEGGPVLGKMFLRFAKLLRSHGLESDLVDWKEQILASESARPEALDVLVTVYENQWNKRRFGPMVETARDMAKLYKKNPLGPDAFRSAQKLLLDSATEMHALVTKNKAADGVVGLTTTLASIYDAFTQIVEETDPRIPRVHYNLAETLFEIHEYERATTHYRWVVEHGTWPTGKAKAVAEQAGVADSSLKAIGARYESLRARQLIPGEIKAVALPTDAGGESHAKLDPALAEWLGWVDLHVEKTQDPIENFSFEANRCLYANGQITLAVARMKKFAKTYPASRFAVPSAILALDSSITAGLWDQVHELANEFLEVKEWKATDFGKRLFAVAADAFYKTLEARYQNREYKVAVKRSEEFFKRYGQSQRLGDALFIAGSSALALNDKQKATELFSRLITEAPKSETVRAALLNRASLEEDRYQLAEAARDYRAYLELPSLVDKGEQRKGDDGLRKKALVLAWLSGEITELAQMLASRSICTEKLEEECDRHQALLGLMKFAANPDPDASVLEEATTNQAFEKARKGEGANQPIWAALALEGAKHLAFRDRLVAIRHLAKNWEKLDPLVRFALVPRISRSIPRAFVLNRAAIADVAPLRADQRYITRRVEVIREMENAATAAMSLPWARIRATVLSETAGLYLDLSKGIAKLPAPKNLNPEDLSAYEETLRKLVIPFEEKGQEMRSKAFEIASRFAIEDESFAQVAEPFFQDNPSQAKRLKPEKSPTRPAEICFATLTQVDPSGDWDDLDPKTSDPAEYLKARWLAAVRAKQWQKVGFFLQEAQEKALIQAGVMGVVKAVSMSLAGARGEALAELEEARADLTPPGRRHATIVLIGHYLNSFSRSKTQGLLRELQKISPELELAKDQGQTKGRKPSSDESSFLSFAAEWAGT